MSVPAYPAYRESGVAWLGAVPRHWTVMPLKHMASFAGGGTPSREVPAYWHGDVPWVSPKDMKAEVIRDSEERITQLGLDAGAASLIEPNAVLVVVRSGILRHTIPVAINERPVALNQDMKAIRLDVDRCHPRFMLRLVQGMNDVFLNLWLKQGATVESIEHEYLARTVIPLPPFAEQAAIASFLDRECGMIDALVAEQERLIALLKEKRQAVISHAVTKGLDPDAAMKDSGIAWLGQVPAHWGVGMLSRVAQRVVVGIAEAAVHAYAAQGIPILRSTNIRPGRIEGDILQVDPTFALERGAKMMRASDLVTVRTGHAGVTAVVPPELDGCQCFTMLITSILPDHYPDFFCMLLNSRPLQEYFAVEAWGSAQPNISVPILKAAPVPIPPRDEQEAIVRHIERKVGEFDTLTTEAEGAIALLKERRAALISAAVTGKIDVRGFVAPADAKAA